ncbi:hypothetical protein OUZ56_021309 [Daphnia magna]|uniref:PHD-type domain-containing protein n=1 Tax=Daphnia magna TaxID=35525 RepID=A0ABQ9ZGZ9_9CRUS|nr:hypothetical protein OUZ56_021309 [Daphnia magna]
MAHLLNEVWQNLSASYGQKGFRVCGLYPWNPDAVKCLSKDDESYETDSCETVTKNIDGVPLSSLDGCEDPPAQESSSSESELYFQGFSDISRHASNSEKHPLASVPLTGVHASRLQSDCTSLNPVYSGHAIIAEFEKNISPVTIDRFIQILGAEEQGEQVSKMLDQLSDMDRVKYDLWKDLIQRYFGNIRAAPAVSTSRASSNLDFGPLPTIPKPSRMRDPPLAILTADKAKKHLAEVEKRKQDQTGKSAGKGKALKKKIAPHLDEEFDDDVDEGYLQYMEMNGNFQSLPTPGPSEANIPHAGLSTDDAFSGSTFSSAIQAKNKREKARKTAEKVIVEGSRRSSRIQARQKVGNVSVKEYQETLLTVLCMLCKSTVTEDDCNQCRVCDSWIHNACFRRDILEEFGIPSFCCPTCLNTFVKNRDMEDKMARK